MKLSDYVIDFVAKTGVRHIFMVTGGGAMHLNDSVGQNKNIEYVCNLHEQACAMAAETYAKVNEKLGVALVTMGPGGTNAVTGVAGAWLDSTPCLFLSGQVKRADLKSGTQVRQMGVQEIDIVSIVKSITKYAEIVLEPAKIRYHLEKAVFLAQHGRPGPVWLDIPLDVQGAQINPDELVGFEPSDAAPTAPQNLPQLAAQTIALLNKSERPIILIGNGVRLAGARRELTQLLEGLNLPVLLTWLAHDLLPEEYPLLVGRPGPVAPRGANFALQNSDCLLSIGARLDMVITAYAHKNFARAATKIMVDIDSSEIEKMKMPIDVPVCADAKAFIQEMLLQIKAIQPKDRSAWMKRCTEWKTKYPIVLPEYRNQKLVSTYVFTEALCELLAEGDMVVSGSSGAGIEIFLLVFKAKQRQRILVTTALGAMGYGVPAAIGACLASNRQRTILVDGDGGFQLNVQELETISRLKLPIKIFVLNNQGYSSIRTSQSRYFGRLTGADATSGVTLPPLEKIAAAYGLNYALIPDQSSLPSQISEVLKAPGATLCELLVWPDEPRAPSMASAQRSDGSMVSKPLEDLWPFLEREEFLSNMIIKPLDE